MKGPQSLEDLFAASALQEYGVSRMGIAEALKDRHQGVGVFFGVEQRLLMSLPRVVADSHDKSTRSGALNGQNTKQAEDHDADPKEGSEPSTRTPTQEHHSGVDLDLIMFSVLVPHSLGTSMIPLEFTLRSLMVNVKGQRTRWMASLPVESSSSTL